MMALAFPVSGSDYDFDAVQPYFLSSEEEEEFFPPPRSQLLPGPGEDIWKKFELLLTPPLSPSRTPPQSESSLSTADHPEAVWDLLDEDRSSSSSSFLQSFIIQDCMWSSSFAAATKLEKMVSERLTSLQTRRDSSDTSGVSDLVPGPQVNTEYLQDLHAAAAACVDPSAVFPYATLAEGPGDDDVTMEAESELSLESPPLSSDCDSGEEEEEEEEDEEVDVVTVDRRGTSRRSDASPLVLKRAHVSVHQHDYAAPRPAGKRLKAEPPAGRGGERRCWSPRSDGEDEDKRRSHNVLERQRRDELRRSFLSLRDQVPAVANSVKAAKVVILKEAAAFVTRVREEEERLLTMKDTLTKRSTELRRRLLQLRT